MALSSSEKKLFILSAFVVILPLGGGLFFNRINATPIISIPLYPQASRPNGFDLYSAAGTALTLAKPAVDSVLDDLPPNTANARAKRYSLARKMAWLRANRAAFALLAHAQKTPSLAPSWRHNGGSKWPVTQLSEIARAKRVETHARRMQSDWTARLRAV